MVVVTVVILVFVTLSNNLTTENVAALYNNQIECGFSATSISRRLFSLACFVMLVMFVIFDLEVICVI